VVHGGGHLSSEAMQSLTNWLGFSETTFLLPPSDPAADYRVRIFCLGRELPFAGHPTLGTCHAWLEQGGMPRDPDRIVQECGVGLVPVQRDGERLAFRAPPLTRTGPLSEVELATAARVAGIEPEVVVEAVHVANGPEWQMLRLATAAQVLEARPVARAPIGTDIGLAGPHEPGSPVEWELRTFVSLDQGQVVEDPVTGSFNAGVAMHLFASGLANRAYVAGQGRKVGADGRIHCRIDEAGAVWIGGRVDTIAIGASLSLPD